MTDHRARKCHVIFWAFQDLYSIVVIECENIKEMSPQKNGSQGGVSLVLILFFGFVAALLSIVVVDAGAPRAFVFRPEYDHCPHVRIQHSWFPLASQAIQWSMLTVPYAADGCDMPS